MLCSVFAEDSIIKWQYNSYLYFYWIWLLEPASTPEKTMKPSLTKYKSKHGIIDVLYIPDHMNIGLFTSALEQTKTNWFFNEIT